MGKNSDGGIGKRPNKPNKPNKLKNNKKNKAGKTKRNKALLRENINEFPIRMQKKLLLVFFGIVLILLYLSYRLVVINRDDGEKYKRQVLSQQRYDSIALPYRRGEILDSKGTKLAVSEKVYNVILDCGRMSKDEKVVDSTLQALYSQFGLSQTEIRKYKTDNPNSRYHILKKGLTYDEVSGFFDLMNSPETKDTISGIWFEENYRRSYPNGTLACDVIGFTSSDNNGLYGLEEYYNDILNGTDGREYGYLNEDSSLERTTIAAVDGNNIVTTIDANIQGIVEKNLLAFNEKYKNNVREGNGANNLGCIIMDVNTGDIRAMASYPVFDPNKPYDLSAFYTDEEVEELKGGEKYYEILNSIWKNFCISETYEPGSVAKGFTVAAALDSGKITGNEVYECGGYLNIDKYKIKCHNVYGDGALTVKGGIAQSCNVAMMKIAQQTGKNIFMDYQRIFNMGLKTGIDLAGESRTENLVFSKESTGPVELATASFGQGQNATMIEMIAGFSSLINGGYYYEPHVVSKVLSPDGATVQNIKPRILKQTISNSTSEKMKEYFEAVVTEGTGKTARPAGYRIAGKTGTAQTLPRGNGEFVLSFLGYAPVDNPQVAVYVVVDRPNVSYQADVKLATTLVRSIMSEVLPYMNIYMTELLTEAERKELEEKSIAILDQYAKETALERGEGIIDWNGDGEPDDPAVWMEFETDAATGYKVDPKTGHLIDPDTGYDMTDSSDFVESDYNNGGNDSNDGNQ